MIKNFTLVIIIFTKPALEQAVFICTYLIKLGFFVNFLLSGRHFERSATESKTTIAQRS